jgi:signal transduction histidine kinase
LVVDRNAQTPQTDIAGSLASRQEGATGSALVMFLTTALVIGSYVALEWLSFMHAYKGIPVTPWNPGLGVLFGLIVVNGPRYAVLLGIGVYLADTFVLRVDVPGMIVVGVAGFTALGYGLAAHVLRRSTPIMPALPRMQDVVLLLGVGITAAIITGAVIAGLLVTDNELSQADLLSTTLPMVVGDILGVAVFAPTVLRLADRAGRHGGLIAFLPTWEMVAIAGGIFALAASLHLAFDLQGLRYLFVFFVPVVIAAVRHGLDGACFSLAASQLALVGVLHAAGRDVPTFAEAQLQMLVLTVTGLIVGAIVSERQEMEAKAVAAAARLKELELEADQAARFSLAGGMASALAHEINQPITAVRALARTAQHLMSGPHADLKRADRNLTEVIAQVDHASQIVRRMREFLRRGRPHVSTIDIATLLRNAVSLIATEAADQGVPIILRCEQGLPPLFGDRTQIEQVLLNLMRNGVEAVRDSNRIDGRVEIGARPAGDMQVEFFVRDNGSGVSDVVRDRLFAPLESAKPQGLGLGLAISAGIIQSHNGRLWLAESARGKTEFRFVLPLDLGGDE